MDARLKPWLINTGKAAGVAAGAAVVGTIYQEVLISFFANSAYGVAAAFVLGVIMKSPFFNKTKAGDFLELTGADMKEIANRIPADMIVTAHNVFGKPNNDNPKGGGK